MFPVEPAQYCDWKVDVRQPPEDDMTLGRYRQIEFGVEVGASGDVARHLHRAGYANVVLAGSFTEAAFAGRTKATPGTVLLHNPFDAHANVEGSTRGLTILRLPWRSGVCEGAFNVHDPDFLARLAESDVREAEYALTEMMGPLVRMTVSWVDDLASALASQREISLRHWAESRSMKPASLSRGFRNAYGVSPQRFRLEARSRLAWRRIVTEIGPLTSIAHECSFADLAHMSRSVLALTGASPRRWRCHRTKGKDKSTTSSDTSTLLPSGISPRNTG